MELKLIKGIFIFNLCSFCFIYDNSLACEKFVVDFAKDYCSMTKSVFNPVKNYMGLKKKYQNEILSSKVDNQLLISNIFSQCPEKKHYFLRFLNKVNLINPKNQL